MTRRIALLILSLLLFTQPALAGSAQRPGTKATSELNQPIELEGKLKIIKKTKTAPAYAVLILSSPRAFQTGAGTSAPQTELIIQPTPKKALSGKLVRVKGILIASDDANPLPRDFGVVQASVVAIPKAKSVMLNKKDETLTAGGDTLKLTATVKPEAAQQAVQWISSNPSVATVDQSGLVTTMNGKGGKATITAKTANGKKATCSLTVQSEPTDTAVMPNNKRISIGVTLQLNVWINGIKADPTSVMWMSTNAAVASVNESGLVTSKAVGITNIICTDLSGYQLGLCLLSVDRLRSEGEPNDLEMRMKSPFMRPGKTQQLSLVVRPAKFKLAGITWRSDNPSVATVSKNGLVTTHAPGRAVISALASYSIPEEGYLSPTAVILVSDTEPLPPTYKADPLSADDFVLKVGGQALELGMTYAQARVILPGLTPAGADAYLRVDYYDDPASGIRLGFSQIESHLLKYIICTARATSLKTARGVSVGDSIWDIFPKYGGHFEPIAAYEHGKWSVKMLLTTNQLRYLPKLIYSIDGQQRVESFLIQGHNM